MVKVGKSNRWLTCCPPSSRSKTAGRFVIFDKSHKKEHGAFLFRDENNGIQYQLPLIGPGNTITSDNLAFPHCSGIFDWPVNKYLPVMMPELTFGDQVIIPSYYGKNCVTGIGLKKSFYLRFDQPDLVKTDGTFAYGIGSCHVQWSFGDGRVQSEFTFKVKNQVTMDSMRLALVIGSPHTSYRLGTTIRQGPEGCVRMWKLMTSKPPGGILKPLLKTQIFADMLVISIMFSTWLEITLWL